MIGLATRSATNRPRARGIYHWDLLWPTFHPRCAASIRLWWLWRVCLVLRWADGDARRGSSPAVPRTKTTARSNPAFRARLRYPSHGHHRRYEDAQGFPNGQQVMVAPALKTEGKSLHAFSAGRSQDYRHGLDREDASPRLVPRRRLRGASTPPADRPAASAS